MNWLIKTRRPAPVLDPGNPAGWKGVITPDNLQAVAGALSFRLTGWHYLVEVQEVNPLLLLARLPPPSIRGLWSLLIGKAVLPQIKPRRHTDWLETPSSSDRAVSVYLWPDHSKGYISIYQHQGLLIVPTGAFVDFSQGAVKIHATDESRRPVTYQFLLWEKMPWLLAGL